MVIRSRLRVAAVFAVLFAGITCSDATGPSNGGEASTTPKLVTVGPADTTLSGLGSVTLRANVSNAAGSPVSAVLITWTSSDPTLATVTPTGATSALVVSTGKRGVVTVSAFASAGVVGTATVNLVPGASRLALITGDAQSGIASRALPQPIVVEVQGTDARPLPGVTVTFRANSPGGSVTSTTAISDASGRASTGAVLGRALGSYQFEAAVAGLAPVMANAVATAPLPAAITVVSGNSQVDSLGRTLSQPLVVRVSDDLGAPVAGAAVTFARVDGTGTLGSTSSTTSGDGLASTTYTLGGSQGVETVVASIAGGTGSGTTATFSLRAIPLAPRTILFTNPLLSALAGSSVSVAVRAADAEGRGVAGVLVAWAASGTGIVSPATSVTDGSGVATATVSLGSSLAGTTVSATAGTLSATATISVRAGSASAIAIVSGDNQTDSLGRVLSQPLVVRVVDAAGLPVSGAAVAFSRSAGTGSVVTSNVTTGANGLASTTYQLGSVAGAEIIAATAGGSTVSFSARAIPLGPSALAFVPAAVSGAAGTAIPISVKATDTGGRGVAGVAISWSVTGTGTITPASSVTDATGIATATFQAGGTAGTATLRATSGVLSATATATITSGSVNRLVLLTAPPASIAVASPGIAVRAGIVDAAGNAVAVAGTVVTATAVATPGSATITATGITDASGIAAIALPSYVGTVGTLSLMLSSPGLTAAVAGPIAVTAGPLYALRFVTPPSSTAISDVAFGTQTVLQGVDIGGNDVGGIFPAETRLAGPVGGALVGTNGTLNVAVRSSDATGRITFSDQAIGGPRGGYTLTYVLTATGTGSSGFGPSLVAPVTLTTGRATQIIFTQGPPASLSAGAGLPVTVQLADAQGSPAVDYSATGIRVGVSVSPGRIGYVSTVVSRSGAFTFTLAAPATAGTYQVLAESTNPAIANGLSTSFTVVAAPTTPTRIVLRSRPDSIIVGQTIDQFVVQLTDDAGTLVPAAGVTITASGTVTPGGATVSGTGTTLSNGTTEIRLPNYLGATGSVALTFSAPGLPSIVAPTIRITPGRFSTFRILTQPSATAQSEVALSTQPVLQAVDAGGNAVAGTYSPNTVLTGPSGSNLTGGSTATNPVSDADGRVQYSGLAIRGAPGSYTLTFNPNAGPGVPVGAAPVSQPITLTVGAPTQIILTQAPPATVVSGGSNFTVKLQLADANGAPTTSASPLGVRITLSSSPSGVFFPSGTFVDPATGSATFSVTVPATAGVYRLVATTPDGYTLTTPNSFTVVAGAASRLAIVTQPSATATSGAAFATQPAVQVVDAAGNAVSTATPVSVTVAIASGGGTLSGSATVSTNSAGRATFAGLAIAGTAGARTLTFGAPSLTSVVSSAINVQP